MLAFLPRGIGIPTVMYNSVHIICQRIEGKFLKIICTLVPKFFPLAYLRTISFHDMQGTLTILKADCMLAFKPVCDVRLMISLGLT